MPTLFENLSNKKQKIAEKIIANLYTLTPTSVECRNILEQYQQQLLLADSFLVFHDIVRAAMSEGRVPYQIYLQATNEMDKDIFDAIEELIKNDSELTIIKKSLHFSSFLENDIIAAKERLSLQSLYSKLSDEDRPVAEKFIQSLKALQTMASALLSDKERFKERLNHAESFHEVAEIEAEIEDHSQRGLAAYEALVPFPDKESVAGALIEFLEKNAHITEVMDPFNFHESLMDDIMASRAKIGKDSSIGPT